MRLIHQIDEKYYNKKEASQPAKIRLLVTILQLSDQPLSGSQRSVWQAAIEDRRRKTRCFWRTQPCLEEGNAPHPRYRSGLQSLGHLLEASELCPKRKLLCQSWAKKSTQRK